MWVHASCFFLVGSPRHLTHHHSSAGRRRAQASARRTTSAPERALASWRWLLPWRRSVVWSNYVDAAVGFGTQGFYPPCRRAATRSTTRSPRDALETSAWCTVMLAKLIASSAGSASSVRSKESQTLGAGSRKTPRDMSRLECKEIALIHRYVGDQLCELKR